MAEYAEAASVRQVGRIAQEMGKRQKIVSALCEQVARLEHRLNPILGPHPPEPNEPPVPGAERPTVGSQSTNHADNLYEDNAALGRIIRTLTVIEQRIEL